MLIRQNILVLIKAGKVSFVFRRWEKPRVKVGSTFKTAVGVLRVESLTQVAEQEVTAASARLAGYDSREELFKDLASGEGTLYKIELAYVGADPRIALREKDIIAAEDMETLHGRLRSFDARSTLGPWTRKVLLAIEKHPRLPAVELATRTGFEKEWLKLHVRKLKNLGLTISHTPGSELSPRGEEVLRRLKS